MTAEQPKVNRTDRYTILRAAKVLEVAPNTIRRYIALGVIKCGIRKATNTMYVEGSEILKFWNNHY